MKKNIKTIAIPLLVLVTTVLWGQNDANQLVKNTVKSLRDHKNVEMSFSYQYVVDASNASDERQGTAYLQGESYKVIMDEQQTISDGKTIWTYLVDDEEVMVSDASEGTDNTPLKLITLLDKDYTAKLIKTDAKGLSQVELLNPNGQYKRITVKIDSKKETLKSAEIFADDGSKMVIRFKEMKFDQDFKDGFFRFDEKAYPDVDIIDMR